MADKKTVSCDKCNGSGKVGERRCPKCGGVGQIVERTTDSGLVHQSRVLNEG